MLWAPRLVWRQGQFFEAWSVSRHPQGMTDDWMRGFVEDLVAHLFAHGALREQLSLLGL